MIEAKVTSFVSQIVLSIFSFNVSLMMMMMMMMMMMVIIIIIIMRNAQKVCAVAK